MKLILLITVFITSHAFSCSYGENWSDDSIDAVNKKYGTRASNVTVADIKDRSYYFLGRDNGVRCPDFIRGTVIVTFTIDNLKSCRSFVKFLSNDIFKIKKTICKVIN